jgi:hypothetical protein
MQWRESGWRTDGCRLWSLGSKLAQRDRFREAPEDGLLGSAQSISGKKAFEAVTERDRCRSNWLRSRHHRDMQWRESGWGADRCWLWSLVSKLA